MHLTRAVAMSALLALGACSSGGPSLPPEAGFGPNPQLPKPAKGLFPVVKVAKAVGWPEGAAPTPAAGLRVNAFARGLNHPRWVLPLANGDVLVAESAAPPKEPQGFKDWVMGQVMKFAGSAVKSPNRITLLRDANGDGAAETRSVLIANVNSPFGMALVGDQLYVAAADALLRYPFQVGQTQITAAPVKVADLPGGPINHHWTKNVIASPDGSKLYVTVGSNSNVAERGMQAEVRRAAILEIDAATGAVREFATGLRNPNGMDWQPETGALWTVVNERDEIGNDLVPDYMTSVRDGGFYGWPYSYYGQTVDARVKPPRPDLVARAIKPDYALGSHTASLGLAFARGGGLGPQFANGVFIGQHGSWNRTPAVGYKVIFVPFQGGRPSGPPQDVLGGFLNEEGQAQGRPVGVAQDRTGALLVADDVGDVIWRVAPTVAVIRGALPVRGLRPKLG